MSPEEIQKHKAQVIALSGKLFDAAEGESHELLLKALINTFVVVAEKHRCCTRTAAYAAILAAERLDSTADANAAETETRPQGVPLH